jgi:hypothetical protein
MIKVLVVLPLFPNMQEHENEFNESSSGSGLSWIFDEQRGVNHCNFLNTFQYRPLMIFFSTCVVCSIYEIPTSHNSLQL